MLNNDKKKIMSQNKEIDEITGIIIESIWIIRWNKNKTALTSVLEPKEAEKAAKDVIKNLKKHGYSIELNNDKKSHVKY